MAADQAIRVGEWLTIIATLLGPILAVQAQKWVELSRAKKQYERPHLSVIDGYQSITVVAGACSITKHD